MENELYFFILIQHFLPVDSTPLYPDCGNNVFRGVIANNDFTTTDHQITTKHPHDVASCTSECFRNMACVAAILDVDICHLYSNYLTFPTGNSVSTQGAVYYEFEGVNECTEGSHTCVSPANICEDTSRSYRCVCGGGYTWDGTACTGFPMSSISCTNDADCTMDNTRCGSTSCECQLGYSYNPSDDTCVAVCVNYGTEFVPQSSGSGNCMGSGHYKKKGLESLSECRSLCIGEANKCKTIQFDSEEEQCYRYEVTYLDAHAVWGNVQNCAYYQRSCAP